VKGERREVEEAEEEFTHAKDAKVVKGLKIRECRDVRKCQSSPPSLSLGRLAELWRVIAWKGAGGIKGGGIFDFAG
jgi:hypothetical protein